MNLVPYRAASICLCALVLVAQAAGCGDDEGDDTATSVAGTSEGTDAMTAGSASQTTSTTTPGTSDPTDPSTDPTMASGSMSGSDADTGSVDTGTVSCEPEDGDDECNACTKESCCDQLGACFASEACTCMTGCATGLDSIAMCTEKCGTSMEFSGLTQCVTVNCAADCI